MRTKWICPICESKKWRSRRKNMWDNNIFPKRKLFICADCHCGSMYPPPLNEELEEINEIYWTKYSPILEENIYKKNYQAISRVNYLKKFTKLTQFEKILDIGAGTGNFLDAMKFDVPDFSNYYAIEPDNKMREIIKSKGSKKVFKKVEEVQEKDFSIVIMAHVLEHIKNPKNFLLKVLRIMRKDAFLFIEVPNRDDLYKRKLGLHTLVFNVNGIHNFISRIGFIVINLITVGPTVQEMIPNINKISIPKKIIKRLIWRLNKTYYLMETKPICLIKSKISYKKENLYHKKKDRKKFTEFEEYGKNRRWIRLLVKK